ncbi:MAG: rane protein [Rhizobacter sp.]|nr:rane protein [Rhizobacter sp.]
MFDPPSALARRVAWWFFIAGVAAYLLLSPQALSAIGIPYDEPGGSNPFVKIHIGTWLIMAAFGLMLTAYGNPLRTAASLSTTHRLLAVLLAFQVFVLVWAVAWHGGSGAANIIDSLLLPVLATVTVTMFEASRRYRCLELIVAVLVVNALLGIGEALMHTRLIPLTIGSQVVIEDIFRPSALFGHPLTNSMITATLLPAVLYLRISTAWRSAIALLLWIAVLAFGGRTGFVLSTIAYGLCLAVLLVRTTAQGRFSYVQITGGLLLAMVGIAVLASAIAATGIGERIFVSLSWDGSAAVRVRIWDVFDYLNIRNWLIGVEPADLPALNDRLGLADSEAIENFWLVMFLKLGLSGFVVFASAMVCAFAWLWRSSHGAMRVGVCLFFIIASSNNSLATKTDALMLLMVVVGITHRMTATRRAGLSVPEAAPRRRPTSRSWSSSPVWGRRHETR